MVAGIFVTFGRRYGPPSGQPALPYLAATGLAEELHVKKSAREATLGDLGMTWGVCASPLSPWGVKGLAIRLPYGQSKVA